MSELSPRARKEVQKLADAVARRLLDQLDADAVGAAPGADHGAGDGGPDESPLIGEGEALPPGVRVEDEGAGGTSAA